MRRISGTFHMVPIRIVFVLMLVLSAGIGMAQTGPAALDNDTIMRMVAAGVPSDVIIRTIQAADSVSFRLLPYDLDVLQRAKVPEDVVKAMAARAAGRPVSGQTQTSPAPGQPAVVGVSAPPPTPPLGDVYQTAGMWNIGLSAAAFIPHYDPSQTFGLVSLETGYFVTRGSLIGADISAFFDGGSQDIFLAGKYRYFFGKATNKILPYLGGGAGGNIAHASGFGTAGNFLAEGGAGVRVFLAPHVAIDIGYSLEYVHVSGLGFKDSSFSLVTIGFAHVFGKGR